jgi:hypothetical protein
MASDDLCDLEPLVPGDLYSMEPLVPGDLCKLEPLVPGDLYSMEDLVREKDCDGILEFRKKTKKLTV